MGFKTWGAAAVLLERVQVGDSVAATHSVQFSLSFQIILVLFVLINRLHSRLVKKTLFIDYCTLDLNI